MSTRLDKEEEIEDHDQALQRATEHYDVVIDIHGLGALKMGWGIYGSPDSKNRIGNQRGRVVGVVGHFKVGKTWLAKKLMEDDSSLIDHEITPTLGVSMKIKKSKSQASNQSKTNTQTSGFRRIGVNTQKSPSKVSAESNEIIILDTQGTNSPSRVSMLNDVRATEVFLRELVLEFTQRIILVIGEFDKSALVDIDVLLKQLDNKHKAATSTNRLIVIHNYKTIESKGILEKKIETVANSYDNEWEVVKPDALITNGGQFTTHLFFVKDKEGWCRDHNNKVISWLLSLIDKDQLNDLFLLKKVEEVGTNLLSNYIKDWEDTFMLQVSEDTTMIKPVLFSPPEKNSRNNNEDDPEADEETQQVYTPMTDDEKIEFQAILDNEANFELQDLEFSDVGVTSATRVILPGSVRYSERAKKFIIAIVAPGFNPDNKNEAYIKYKFQGHHKITVWLRLDRLDPPEAEGYIQQYSNVKYGRGIFEYEFPSKRSFKWPDTKEEFYESRMKVYNGQLLLFLDQEIMA